MRTFRLPAVLAVVLAGVACGDSTSAAVTTWTANIAVVNETPAPGGSSSLAGTATVTLTGGGSGTGTLTYTLALTGTPTSAITAAHIHGGTAAAGAAGTTGPVRVNLCGVGLATDNRNSATYPACTATGVPSTTVTWASGATVLAGGGLTFDQMVAAMRAYNMYVNVHTATNGGGEARGQLVAPALP
jgi:hypothetical protein